MSAILATTGTLAVPETVPAIINDVVAHLGISPLVMATEIAQLAPGAIWSTNRLSLNNPDITMLVKRDGSQVTADVSFANGYRIEGRIGESIAIIVCELPETLKLALPGRPLGDLLDHPLAKQPGYIMGDPVVPGHGLWLRIPFRSPGEPLAGIP